MSESDRIRGLQVEGGAPEALREKERRKEKKKEEQRGPPRPGHGMLERRLPKPYTTRCQPCFKHFTHINILMFTIGPHEVGTIIPPLSSAETKCREIKQFDQGHAANKRQSFPRDSAPNIYAVGLFRRKLSYSRAGRDRVGEVSKRQAVERPE